MNLHAEKLLEQMKSSEKETFTQAECQEVLAFVEVVHHKREILHEGMTHLQAFKSYLEELFGILLYLLYCLVIGGVSTGIIFGIGFLIYQGVVN